MKTARALLAVLYLALGAGAYCAAAPSSPTGAGAPAPAPASARAPSPAPTTTKPVADLSVPKDGRAEWKVGFSVLSAEGLSPENAYLVFSIPLLLKDELSDVPSHALSGEERNLRAKSVIERELRTASQSVAAARKTRDDAFFDGTLPAAGGAAGTGAADPESRLAVAIQRRDFLISLDAGAIDVEARKPILFREGATAGNLLDAPKYAIQQMCEQQDVDLLVGGTIREVQGYLLIDIWAYDSLQSEFVFSYREAALREEMYAYLTAIGQGLTGVLAGGVWAALELSVTPAASTVMIDGVAASAGTSRLLYLAPGSKTIEVKAPGYTGSVQTVDLPAEKVTALRIDLERVSVSQLAISSDPPGANVYVSSLWVGKTPVSIDRPAERARALVTLDGYYDVPFSIGAATSETVSIALRENLASLDKVQDDARETFYTSFGWFVVSLPVPLFCYAFAGEYATQVQMLGYQGDQARKAQTIGNVFYFSYLAGVAASATLASYMVYTLVRYVNAADRKAG